MRGFVLDIKHDFFQDVLVKLPNSLANADHFKWTYPVTRNFSQILKLLVQVHEDRIQWK